jgi:hypothetical protein
MESETSPDTSVASNQVTQCHNPQDNLHFHLRKHLNCNLITNLCVVQLFSASLSLIFLSVGGCAVG